MKITGIDESLSSPTQVAIITEPPISEDVFLEIKMMTRDDLRSPLEPSTPLLSSLNLWAIKGRLIAQTKVFDAHIAENIQCLLDEAEKRANKTKQARENNSKKETEANQNMKQALIDSAISAFKLPKK